MSWGTEISKISLWLGERLCVGAMAKLDIKAENREGSMGIWGPPEIHAGREKRGDVSKGIDFLWLQRSGGIKLGKCRIDCNSQPFAFTGC